jgi:sterol desaturase/sphingolipid hydroxylase (fatty acid hydroxylase superfamily)
MDQALEFLLAWKVVLVGGWLAAFFLAERLRPAARPPAGPRGGEAAFGLHRLLRNAGLWLGNVGMSVLLVVPLSLWAASVSLDWRPAWWAGWPGLLLDLAILDFAIYWWHRANHELPPLWRFHEVHHLDRFLDTTSAVRFHFGEVALSAVFRAGLIVLLGFPLSSVIAFEVLVLLCAIFHHSNLRLPAGLERALGWVVVTPEIHWVHHHAVRRDTDSNYGTLFSFWDRLFGSKNPARRRLGMPIGVERRIEQPLPHLLLRPFLPERRRAAAPPVPEGGAEA